MEVAPKVSVIVPAYNIEPFIGECLDSVKAQTMPNFEVIVINDGSTDDTGDAILNAIGTDSRFIYLEQQNAGISVARNRALKHTSGDYVYFLDGDDLIHPEAFERLVRVAESADLDMVHFNASTFVDGVKGDHGASQEHQDNYIRSLNSEGLALTTEMLRTGQFRSSVWLYIIRRTFIEANELGFIDGALHEDEAYTLKACVLSEKSRFIEDCLFFRRLRPSSIMTAQRTSQNALGYFQAFEECSSWFSGLDRPLPDELIPLVHGRIGMLYLHALRVSIRVDCLNELRKVGLPHLARIFRHTTLKNSVAILLPRYFAAKFAT
ncbi:glycosyltransferase [Marinobacter sp. 1Y8]